MKLNIINKIVFIFLNIILVLSVSSINVQATSIKDIFTGADDFIQSGIKDTNPTIEDKDLENMSNLLYNTLLIIATVIAVIVGLVIGIQFMTGSVSQKAKIKETLIPYIAGCIVIFGAFGIWKLVVTIMSTI